MNVSKIFASTVAAAAVVGVVGFAYAQTAGGGTAGAGGVTPAETTQMPNQGSAQGAAPETAQRTAPITPGETTQTTNPGATTSDTQMPNRDSTAITPMPSRDTAMPQSTIDSQRSPGSSTSTDSSTSGTSGNSSMNSGSTAPAVSDNSNTPVIERQAKADRN
jgi:hypothetical protein